jgi:hypothetical protein
MGRVQSFSTPTNANRGWVWTNGTYNKDHESLQYMSKPHSGNTWSEGCCIQEIYREAAFTNSVVSVGPTATNIAGGSKCTVEGISWYDPPLS